VNELRALAELRSSIDTSPADFVFEDVYHFAFFMLDRWRPIGELPPAVEHCKSLYRGQRQHVWPIEPSILRNLASFADSALRTSELRRRARTAGEMGHAVSTELRLDFDEAMAVAQHYSAQNELGVPTWLVDFTRDPWTALFFASDGGVTGEYGVVWQVFVDEFSDHASGEGNPLGALRLTVPAGILRIENQAGVFASATHPEFFSQYVSPGLETKFRQRTELVFEDAMLGITRERMYPPEDPMLERVTNIKEAVAGAQVGYDAAPANLFADPLLPQAYEALLGSWLTDRTTSAGRSALPDVEAALPRLSQFHALLQSNYRDRLPSVLSRSLNRLKAGFKELYYDGLNERPVSLRSAVMSAYCNAIIPEDHRSVLLEALHQVAPPD
jgi:hypothetical protein